MPRGRPRKIDPKDALKTAMRTFWEQGYERTSMTDLSEATGMAKPGLYNNLGDKDEIFKKALDLYQSEMARPMIEELKGSKEPLKDSLRTALSGIIHAEVGSGLPHGCFVLNSTVHCSERGEDVSTAVRALNMNRRDAFLDRLRRAKKDGELAESADELALANFFSGQAGAVSSMAQAGLPLEDLQRMIDVSLAVLPD